MTNPDIERLLEKVRGLAKMLPEISQGIWCDDGYRVTRGSDGAIIWEYKYLDNFVEGKGYPKDAEFVCALKEAFPDVAQALEELIAENLQAHGVLETLQQERDKYKEENEKLRKYFENREKCVASQDKCLIESTKENQRLEQDLRKCVEALKRQAKVPIDQDAFQWYSSCCYTLLEFCPTCKKKCCPIVKNQVYETQAAQEALESLSPESQKLLTP